MLIGIDSSPCSLSLRNRSTLRSTTKCHQNKSDLKNVFVQKSFFSISSILSIPIMLIGINSGYFPAICRVCFIIICFQTKFEAIIVNVLVFYGKFLRDRFDFSIDFCALNFFVLRRLNLTREQLKSSGGSSLLIVKWKVRGNWCIFAIFCWVISIALSPK